MHLQCACISANGCRYHHYCWLLIEEKKYYEKLVVCIFLLPFYYIVRGCCSSTVAVDIIPFYFATTVEILFTVYLPFYFISSRCIHSPLISFITFVFRYCCYCPAKNQSHGEKVLCGKLPFQQQQKPCMQEWSVASEKWHKERRKLQHPYIWLSERRKREKSLDIGDSLFKRGKV